MPADLCPPASDDRFAMSRKPRLLHVFSTFKVGGPQMRFIALVRALAGQFSHDVIAMDGNHTAGALLAGNADMRLVRLPSPGSLPVRLAGYRRLIARQAPDLLISYNWGAIEWSIADMFGVPHIHIVDGFGPEEAVQRLGRRNLARRLLLPTVDAVVVPSRTLQAIAQTEWGLGGTKLRYIPNGILPSQPSPAPPPDAAVSKIAWAGAMRTEKNIARLLEAFVPLRGRAELVLAGDGPERAGMEALALAMGIEGHVRFLGHREDIGAIFREAHLVALSSDTEQMPLVVLEAMDAGRPVASVDVGDVHAMVAEDNRTFVTGHSAAALSGSMKALLDDPALCARIGAANHRHLEAHYRLDQMARSYRDLFWELIGASP
jgi:glycosyltransferase involved in cell wall biosynthesis